MLDGLTQTFQSINWSNPTWDVVIVLFFLVVGFLYGISLGRSRIIVIIVSVYMALALVTYLPQSWLTSTSIQVNNTTYFINIGAFLGAFVVLFFLLSQSAILASIAQASQGSWWQSLLFSFLHVGLLISVTLSFLPSDASEHLAPLTQTIFVGPEARFAWIAAPILAMLVIREEKDEI